MKNLPDVDHHLLIKEDNPSMSLHSAHRFQAQLNTIDSILFPKLSEKVISTNQVLTNGADNKLVHCQSGMLYLLRPNPTEIEKRFSFELVPQIDFTSPSSFFLHKDGSPRENFQSSLEELKLKQKTLPTKQKVSYPEFIFLGTASSISLPIRNVSGILVNLDEQTSILLECGENTYGQLLRFYGPRQIGQVLRRLRAVFISHHHSDHHMGLTTLISKHAQHNSDKLMLVLPPILSNFLHSHHLDKIVSRCNYVLNYQFDKSRSHLQRMLRVKSIDLIPVNHCAYAYGIAITTANQFK